MYASTCQVAAGQKGVSGTWGGGWYFCWFSTAVFTGGGRHYVFVIGRTRSWRGDGAAVGAGQLPTREKGRGGCRNWGGGSSTTVFVGGGRSTAVFVWQQGHLCGSSTAVFAYASLLDVALVAAVHCDCNWQPGGWAPIRVRFQLLIGWAFWVTSHLLAQERRWTAGVTGLFEVSS